jgi:hypothetical protein
LYNIDGGFEVNGSKVMWRNVEANKSLDPKFTTAF